MSIDSSGVNIILYPRSYNKRGDESGHSVSGVTDDGTEVCVRLKISDQYKGEEWTPSIAEFAREDFRANMICVASEKNSKDEREGVLLFSSATKVSNPSKAGTGIDTYNAKWAHVLSEGKHAPEPIFAMARIEFNRDSSEIKKLKEEISFMSDDPLKKDDVAALTEMIKNPQLFWYSAVIYHYEDLVVIPSDRNALISAIHECLDKNVKSGMTNGFMIRKVDQNGFVVKDSCKEFFSFFLSSQKRNQNGAEFLKRNGSLLDQYGFLDGKYRLEIMPLSRLSGLKSTSRHYGTPDQFKRLVRIYGENDDKRACRAVIKSGSSVNDTLILSRVFPLSSSTGSPELLSKEGLFNKCHVGEKRKLANNIPSAEELVERPINDIIMCDIPILRAEWLLSSPGEEKDAQQEFSAFISEKNNLSSSEQHDEPIITEEAEVEVEVEIEVEVEVEVEVEEKNIITDNDNELVVSAESEIVEDETPHLLAHKNINVHLEENITAEILVEVSPDFGEKNIDTLPAIPTIEDVSHTAEDPLPVTTNVDDYFSTDADSDSENILLSTKEEATNVIVPVNDELGEIESRIKEPEINDAAKIPRKGLASFIKR